MNLKKIHENLWIDLSDIYLIDYDENNDELNVYINMHPKVPIVIKNKHIVEFKKFMEEYNEQNISKGRKSKV